MSPSINIGSSGFVFDGWERNFYPAGTKHREHLLYYAVHIPTVEILATRHLLPRRDVFEKWNAETPSDFIFSFATLKGFSPKYVLAHGTDQIEVFFRRASIMGEKFGPIAITIPEGTPYQKGDALRYFASLPKHRYALDIQAVPWYNSEVFAEMARLDMTFVRDRFDDTDAIGSWDYFRAPLGVQKHASSCACGCGLDASVILRKAQVESRDTYLYAKNGKEGLTPNLILRLLKIFGPSNRVNFVDMSGKSGFPGLKKKDLGPSDPAEGPQYFGTSQKFVDDSDKVDVMKKDPYPDGDKPLRMLNYPDKEWDGMSEPFQDKSDKGY